jgi:ferredoxin
MEDREGRTRENKQSNMFKRLFRQLVGRKQEPKWPSADPSVMQVTSDASRCVQCGICGYNCPVGIEVREYARRGEKVTDFRCIGCGVCIAICPRGTLRWGPAILVRHDNTLEVNPSTLPVTLDFNSRRHE